MSSITAIVKPSLQQGPAVPQPWMQNAFLPTVTTKPSKTTDPSPKEHLMATKNVTDASFAADVLQSDKPVLVDFWAEWCGPCRMVGPILEEISNEHGDKLTIVKLNVDENPSIAANYGVSSIPTMNVFQGGEVVKQIVGAKPKAKLLEDLADYIA
jgi:thioredoxin 1